MMMQGLANFKSQYIRCALIYQYIYQRRRRFGKQLLP